MKILFIYPVPPSCFIPRGFSNGIASISAVLKRAGHTTDLLYVESLNEEDLNRSILAGVDIIAISATTDQFELAGKVVNFIKLNYGIPVILGGVHATVAPEEAIQLDGLTGICIGEGELPLLELVNALGAKNDYLHINNFWFRNGTEIIKNPLRNLISNLDELPFPDRELFDYQQIVNDNYDDGAEFMVGRGCPFLCSFCINKSLQDLYRGKGTFVRYRTVDNVISEIRQVVAKYSNISKITFQDDILALNKKWLTEFSGKYASEIGIPFRCNLRADNVDVETLSLLKQANCSELWVGVETGSERLRNSLLKKQLPTATIVEAFDLIHQYGIKSKAYNMLGLPGETCDDIEETIRLNKMIKPDLKNITIFRPYPGTELYEYCKEKNWISDRKVSGYWEESILDQPSLSKEDTYFYQLLFYYENKAPWLAKIARILNSVRITPRISLFRLLHNKTIMYSLYAMIKRSGRKI
ncbi:MAG: B12-binding domain-containing radical SAM protein [Geobacteraceae bacterium]|nr:B12-binding domain-containing radical SAM protein [Geobacteraceae bacterium]